MFVLSDREGNRREERFNTKEEMFKYMDEIDEYEAMTPYATFTDWCWYEEDE